MALKYFQTWCVCVVSPLPMTDEAVIIVQASHSYKSDLVNICYDCVGQTFGRINETQK